MTEVSVNFQYWTTICEKLLLNPLLLPMADFETFNLLLEEKYVIMTIFISI